MTSDVQPVADQLAGAPVVGVIGGGQLARMMAEPAAALGIHLRVLAEAEGMSAAQVVADAPVGDYRDPETVLAFAANCDVVTFDHEHVPPAVLAAMADAGHVAYPKAYSLAHTQDKYVMRTALSEHDVPVPAFGLAHTPADVDAFAARVGGYPIVAKVRSGGYDGKGVWFVESVDAPELSTALERAGQSGLLLEERVDFVRELSALVARSPTDQAVAYPVVESVQRDGVCVEVTAPAPGLDPDLACDAAALALRIARQLEVVGIMATELFETRDGRVLVNELAMRPHNTGHWTIDAAVTSQFENHLRAVLDLPLGSPAAREPVAVMVNVLGGDTAVTPALSELHPALRHCWARDPALKVHFYGKAVKPGRKVGHVTTCGADVAGVRARARHAADYLMGVIDE